MLQPLVRFAPVLLGVCIVVQAGLNRRISTRVGLATSVLLNGTVLTVLSLALWFAAKKGWLPDEFKPRSGAVPAVWWLLPGCLGLALVVGAPWAISRFGAAHTVVLIVSAQLVTAALWDFFAEGIALTPARGIGIALAWIGVIVAARSN